MCVSSYLGFMINHEPRASEPSRWRNHGGRGQPHSRQELASQEGPESARELRRWLMERFGLWWREASVAAAELRDAPALAHEPPAELIDEQYSGSRAPLRPICNRILAAVTAFGHDVTTDATSSEVYLVRREVFAVVRAETTKHVEIGLALSPELEPVGRLDGQGMDHVSERITHRMTAATPGEVDREVVHRLHQAYDRAG